MHIYDVLIDKGIEVNEVEALELQSRWDALQVLKKDLDQVVPNQADIALRFAPNESFVIL
jgi:hypothetical protein